MIASISSVSLIRVVGNEIKSVLISLNVTTDFDFPLLLRIALEQTSVKIQIFGFKSRFKNAFIRKPERLNLQQAALSA